MGKTVTSNDDMLMAFMRFPRIITNQLFVSNQ